MNAPAPLHRDDAPFRSFSRRGAPGAFAIHTRALPAFDTLSDAELEAAERALLRLAEGGEAEELGLRVVGEGGKGEALLMRATPDLWLIVRRPWEGRGPPEVLDVVRSEFIANFQRAGRNGA